MCGITGFFNIEDNFNKTINSLEIIKLRGKDGCGIATNKKIFYGKNPKEFKNTKSDYSLGHCLHSVVGTNIKQPIKTKNNVIVSNCEIYNWKELASKYNFKNIKNDSQLIINLLDKKLNKTNSNIDKILEELDGVYAFAYLKDNKLIIARDILGIKPLYYSTDNGFCFCSEKKALEKQNMRNIKFLDPRHILIYDIKTNKISFKKKNWIKTVTNKLSLSKNKEKLKEILFKAITKRIPDQRFALLFSGGIDSVLLATIFKELKLDFTCYFAYIEGFGKPKDLDFAKDIAKKLNIKLKLVSINKDKLPNLLKKLIPLIESSNPIKVGVALPIYLASKQANKDKIKVIFSGLGSDEIFAGYSRFKESNNIKLDSENLLLQMHENDLYRDDIVTMNNSIELRLPYLDINVIKHTLSIPSIQKIDTKKDKNKIIIREIAKDLNLDKIYSDRNKVAAQYGSNFDKAITKIAKENKFKGKGDYLATFANKKNLKLGCLYSGGKDSNLALWIMKRQNYDINCLLSIIPDNNDSYMYQKPIIDFLKLQSKACQIPLLTKKSKGEKEKELLDLKKLLIKAKKEYNIDGVICGALFSNYQRERIQNICVELQLRLFAPLWHKKQDKELLELNKEKFSFILSKVAALGMDETWLGREIKLKDINELIKLNKKFGFNVAGEGGEYESLVIDAPFFKKKIEIVKTIKKMENNICGTLYIKEAKLISKK